MMYIVPTLLRGNTLQNALRFNDAERLERCSHEGPWEL